jgi:DNA-binding MarR family transcriptional regulator
MRREDSPAVERLLESVARFRRLARRPDRAAGLTHTRLMILSTIHDAGAAGATLSELGRLLQVAGPTATQQVNGLARQGFVEKTADGADRRAVRVRLTRRGECALEDAFQAFAARLADLVAYLGPEDSDELARLLAKVFTYLHESRHETSHESREI